MVLSTVVAMHGDLDAYELVAELIFHGDVLHVGSRRYSLTSLLHELDKVKELLIQTELAVLNLGKVKHIGDECEYHLRVNSNLHDLLAHFLQLGAKDHYGLPLVFQYSLLALEHRVAPESFILGRSVVKAIVLHDASLYRLR